MAKDPIVLYLLDENHSPLFDMNKFVKDNIVLPLKGYGLKDVCKHKGLVDFQWEDEGSGSQWSVVQFNLFQAETNRDKKEDLKSSVFGYNRDDVIATYRLEQWLKGLGF